MPSYEPVDDPALWVAVEATGPPFLVSAAGVLDLMSADLLTAFVDGLRGPAGVVLDLSQVEFVDAYGLAALGRINASVRDRGAELVLRDVHPYVWRLIRLAGLARAFRCTPRSATGAWTETDH